MKKISIVTATRAEYGLLKPIMRALKSCKEIDLEVVVTGAHLSPEFGLTYQEIIADDIKIDKKIEILMSGDTPSAISKSMGLAIIGFADYLKESLPDLLIVLGDRYETLAVAISAMNQRIPIAHLYGGEATEGLIDESIRHAITKLSYLHFTSTELYRRRVIQLGEHPQRVFNVGSIGVENIKKNDYISRDELSKSLGLSLDVPYVVVTFHPVTLEDQSSESQIIELLKAIDSFKAFNYIFTKANSDAEGRIINEMIDDFVVTRENCISVASLGLKRYLTAVRYAYMVVGNSSSGIIEVPSFKVPTINIGDRQKGRIQAESVINCQPISTSIELAFQKAGESNFREMLAKVQNPYDKNNTCDQIVRIISEYVNRGDIDIKKKFYDLDL